MTASWTFRETMTVDAVDVSAALIKHNIKGSLSTAIFQGPVDFSTRKLNALLTIEAGMEVIITRNYTVTIDGGTPFAVDQIIFRGVTMAPDVAGPKTSVQVKDKLELLAGDEVNKIYGTTAVPVDISEIIYDIIIGSGLRCTYNVTGATVQKSGITTSGMPLSHKNRFAAVKDLADALGWQFYYEPVTDYVYVESKTYRSTDKPSFVRGDFSGRPDWTPDSSQLCNSCTVMPKAERTIERTYIYNSAAVMCSIGGTKLFSVTKRPAAIQITYLSPYADGLPGPIYGMTGQQVGEYTAQTRTSFLDYCYTITDTGADIVVFNSLKGQTPGSGYYDMAEGSRLAVDVYYDKVVPQTYVDEAAIATLGYKAHKNISRPDLSAAEALLVAKAYVTRFSAPLEQVSFENIHDPYKAPWLNQLCDINDGVRSATSMAAVSLALKYPGNRDTVSLGQYNANTADYTTGLEARIRQLEMAALDADYTQAQYIPLGGEDPGSGGSGTGSIVIATHTIESDGSTAVSGVGISNQGKLFYDNGYYYFPWFDGSNMVYRSSADLTTWGTKTTICAETAGYQFCWVVDSNHKVHYVRGSGAALKYRRGTIGSNGIITWDFAEIDALAGGSAVTVRSIALDSDGSILYAYQRDGQVYVNKVSYSTALAAASAYPKALTSSTAHNYFAKIVSLGSGAWFCAYGDDAGSTKIRGRRFSGSVLYGEENCSLGNVSANYRFTIVSDAAGQVHLAYNKTDTDFRAMYRMRSSSGTWDAAEYDVVGAAVTYLVTPYITRGASGQQYVWWMGSPNAKAIYYRGHALDGTWDAAYTVAFTETEDLPSPDTGVCVSTPDFNGRIAMGYMADAASPYTPKLLVMSFDGTGTGGGGGGETPSTGGRVTMSEGVLYGPDGNPIHLKMTNDSATLCGFMNARLGTYDPDSTLSCPVTGTGAIDCTSSEAIATFFYRYALALKSIGLNGVRIGAHTAWGLDALYTAWRASATQFDKVLVAMAQGLEAAGFYYQITCSGFAETPVSEGGHGYENRQLLTTMTAVGSHLSATGHLTDNILYVGCTSHINFENFLVHVGDTLADMPHFVAVEIANEPDNWRQHPTFWDAVYGTDYSSGGAVFTAMSYWGAMTAMNMRTKRTKTTWLITNGWTPLAGPPFLAQFSAMTRVDAAKGIADLNQGMDIAGFHSYHFNPSFCDSYNSGTCDGTTCGQSLFMAAIKTACAAYGMAVCNNEWGRYCDSYQVFVQTIADTMTAAGVHWAAIVAASRPAIGSATLPTGWNNAGTGSGGGTTTTTYAYTVTKSGTTYTATKADGTVLTSGSNAATVINAAIAALPAGRTTKAAVKLTGAFSLLAPIQPANYTLIELSGTATWGDTGVGFMVYASGKHDVEIVGGTWDGQRATRTVTSQNNIMQFETCETVNIHDLTMTGACYDSLECLACDNVTAYNVESADSAWDSFMMAWCSNCLIEDCYVHDSDEGGIYFYTEDDATVQTIANNIVRGCKVERTFTSGISFSTRGAEDIISGGIIEDNTVTDCGTDLDHPGINVGYSSPGVGTIVRNNHVKATGSTMESGIEFMAENGQCYGNTVTDAPSYGITVRGSGNSVTGNTIDHAGWGDAYSTGVVIAGDNNVVNYNTITDCPNYGLWVYSGSGNTIAPNTYSGNGADVK